MKKFSALVLALCIFLALIPCAAAEEEEPIAIVMFTTNALYSDETLSAYCTAMCDYTESNIEKKAPENQ